MRSYRKSSHTVYDLKVYLVWVTKYCYQVLTRPIGIRTRELIRQICDTNRIVILKGRVSKDHVHLYISYPPKLAVSEIVRLIKGSSDKRADITTPSGRVSSTIEAILG